MSRNGWTKKKANASDDNGWAETGGYMATKISKLDQQFELDAPREKQKEGTCSNIFSGVAIYVNGYTEPSADELRRLMMLHGGQFHIYYSRTKTTHIIANNLPNCKIQELKGEKVMRPEWITDRNGLLQSSLDVMSHAIMNEMKECGKEDPLLQVVTEVPLTNGHTHLVNGALKPEDLSPVTDEPCVYKELPECRVMSLADKTPVQFQTKPDPYEFPHSPPKQCHKAASEQRPKPPPPTYEEAIKATEAQLLPKRLQPSLQVGLDFKKTSLSPASCSLSHSPIRLNGSHQYAFSSEPASVNKTIITDKPETPIDHSISPSSKSAPQLLAQTGDLISEFYSHSRLHQISTWRTGFSEYVNELHSKRKTAGSVSFPGKDRLRKSIAQCSTGFEGTSALNSVKSCVLHVDMDCFFVSVGIRHRPDLKGKPVAVTSNRGQGRVPLRPGANPQLEQQYYQRRYSHPQPEMTDDDLHTTPSQESPESYTKGVDPDAAALSMAEIASCSYEARQAGVRNGMFFGKAKQLCPSLQSVPYDFEAYKEVALTMYEILAGYTHDIEALSCDEVLIDGSAVLAELGISPEDLAKAIRAEIKEKTGCCASVGMGSNILLARLATRKAKPEGQHFLRSEDVDDFIRDLPVTNLPGVGPVMGRKLAAVGVISCGDLRQVSLSQLQKKFGPRTGQTLFRFCRGLDDRPVRYEKERKSVSAEMNYNIRFTKIDEAECFLTNLSMEVQRRLQEAGLRGRRVTLKVMVRKVGAPLEPAKYGGHGICDNLARTVMLAQSSDNGQLIAAAVIKLFHAMKLQVQDLRGVGIQVQLLERNQSVCPDSTGHGSRSIKEMLFGQRLFEFKINFTDAADNNDHQEKTSSTTATLPGSSPHPQSSPEPVPGTSKDQLVDPDVFAALPKELQEELTSAYNRITTVQPQAKMLEQKNPLLQLKQPAGGICTGRVKRRYKRKHTTDSGPSTSSSKLDIPESVSKFVPRSAPALAGAYDLTDIKTLLREWVTTITEPMEEDILQVVKYCTELIEDKDLEKLMQQSVESVWSMAFDFILDNVQVVVQQAYGSTLKIT
ncbi:DNA repair protein REV1 [Channa argus]|uniref:DNA repair protein REV1 n=1 Tax=Channa argus TaxID=215402 RepID=A0A6G1PWY5_CHAAH|nr:DNA repair protein REV1 [Channa argus]